MATVTMDLAEVDKLRQLATDANTATATIQKQYVELEKDLALVKANKRVIKITKNKYSNINADEIAGAIQHYLYSSSNGGRYTNTISGYSIKEIIQRYSNPIMDNRPEQTEFVNFEDVKEQLKIELNQKYADTLTDLQRYKRDSEAKINGIKADNEKTTNELLKKHSEEIVIKEKEYIALKEDKETLSLQEQIDKLTKDLAAEKAKKWYQKL